ncbi:hypothetical protein [Enemella evansiae]|uniref:hypothetical protein n=1 Tax=Enemella evansiae TaxID=2016499 RepID=UPI000B972190|nr:hypothetical protein [Enemella evansiae]OYN94326.1 hypothetical protein CGZ96_18405 [Enemella evansiae]OYO06262.1 hypothetical protein CGZ97_06370 [Enemella evansiae]PFG66406.1 hypothetical protein B0O41_1193 [Propionibacteriaceae bacterium ES.041]TDO88000.1 hypothetical protein C8D81_3076 [Enemella evansiae]
MNRVVGYRRLAAGSSLRVIGGVLLGLAGLLAVLVVVVLMVTIPMVVTGVDSSIVRNVVIGGAVVVLCPLILGILMLVGVFDSPLRKISAPDGVAWVLQPGGVLVRTDRGETLIPWSAARFDRVPVAGLPGVRLSGPGVEVAYPEPGLSHNLGQLLALAARYAEERPLR